MSVAYYLPKGYKWLQLFPTLFAFFGAICLIISRTHYSTDVVIAYWLSTYVFRFVDLADSFLSILLDQKSNQTVCLSGYTMPMWKRTSVSYEKIPFFREFGGSG